MGLFGSRRLCSIMDENSIIEYLRFMRNRSDEKIERTPISHSSRNESDISPACNLDRDGHQSTNTNIEMTANEGRYWKCAYEKANYEIMILKKRLQGILLDFPAESVSVGYQPSCLTSTDQKQTEFQEHRSPKINTPATKTIQWESSSVERNRKAASKKRLQPCTPTLYPFKIIKVRTTSIRILTDLLNKIEEFRGGFVKSIFQIKSSNESYYNALILVTRAYAARLRSDLTIRIGDRTHMVFNAICPAMCTNCWSYNHQKAKCNGYQLCKRCSGVNCKDGRKCKPKCRHCEESGLCSNHSIGSHICSIHNERLNKVNGQNRELNNKRTAMNL